LLATQNACRPDARRSRNLVKIPQKMNAMRFYNIMRHTKTVEGKATPAGIEVTSAPAV
jgi:hypothetical protein